MPLPTDAKERKQLQLYTFMFKYFPDAWLEVVRVAHLGNEQHNPGEPLHWARGKSTDQMNAAFNHIFDYGLGVKKDSSGSYHLSNAIWRLMAQLQLDLEAEAAARVKFKALGEAQSVNAAIDSVAELAPQASPSACPYCRPGVLCQAIQDGRKAEQCPLLQRGQSQADVAGLEQFDGY